MDAGAVSIRVTAGAGWKRESEKTRRLRGSAPWCVLCAEREPVTARRKANIIVR
jgi:hypothetical protein